MVPVMLWIFYWVHVSRTYDRLAGSLDGPGGVFEGAGVDPVGEVPHAPHRRRRRRLRGRALDRL